jgi:glyoxylase-like metal-dependent hydrolase (beta-lactamase superfamily II)
MQAEGWTATLIEAGKLPIEPGDIAPGGVFSGRVWAPVNVLLLRGHGRTVLVDAGSGPFVSVWPGLTDDLPGRLEAESASPGLLVLTHFDFDHSGGLVTGTAPDELRPTFPGVTVLAPAEALAEARAVDADGVPTQVVATLDAAGLIEGYDDGAEPAPGLRLGRLRATGWATRSSRSAIPSFTWSTSSTTGCTSSIRSGIARGTPSPRSRSPLVG